MNEKQIWQTAIRNPNLIKIIKNGANRWTLLSITATHIHVCQQTITTQSIYFLILTGLAQCAELVWQLRGQAGKRQVEDAKIGLQHNFGIGGAAVVTLYKKYGIQQAKL